MGWSCRADALDTLKKVDAFCVESTGCSNTWKAPDGREYFYEIGRKEHDDGAITGHVIELGPLTGSPDGVRSGRKVGSFRINGDGSIARMPKPMSVTLESDFARVLRKQKSA